APTDVPSRAPATTAPPAIAAPAATTPAATMPAAGATWSVMPTPVFASTPTPPGREVDPGCAGAPASVPGLRASSRYGPCGGGGGSGALPGSPGSGAFVLWG